MQPLWKRVGRFLKELKIQLPYDPVVPLLSKYTKKMQTEYWKDICTSMYTASLFTIAKLWKQPKHLAMDKENVVYIYTYTHTHTHTEEYPAMRKDMVDLGALCCEKCQMKKIMLLLLCRISKCQTHRK